MCRDTAGNEGNGALALGGLQLPAEEKKVLERHTNQGGWWGEGAQVLGRLVLEKLPCQHGEQTCNQPEPVEY